MNKCKDCGGEVRLSAMKISINRKRGVAHSIVHYGKSCGSDKDYSCAMMKPYPKEDRPVDQMIDRWNAANSVGDEQ